MSKPDVASGSLESILASIRKSLAEQATDAPSETPGSPIESPKEDSARKRGLRHRLAGTTTGQPSGEQPVADDLADLLEEQAAPPAPAASPQPAVESSPEAKLAAARDIKPPEEDPLWFLTRRDEPAPPEPAASSDAPSPAQAPAEPILTRPEVVRASMPPFFGSTAEVVKPDPVPTGGVRQPAPSPQMQPGASGGSVVPAAVPQAPLTQPSASGGGVAQAVVPQAPPVEGAAAKTQPPGGSAPLNGRGTRAGEVPDAPMAVPGGTKGQTAALEAAVLELLKPMLRQWLDQNMPRLVAEALKGEAARVRGSADGGGKV
jgi:uncharacterized protein